MNILNLVRPNILQLQAYSSARSEYSGNSGIFLDANENPYGTLNRYPDPLQQQLKQAIGAWKRIPEERIFLGNGSDEAIDLCIRIFCIPGQDMILNFTPSYGMYTVAATINDIAQVTIPLNEQFQIDFEQLKPWLSHPELKIIFICSPNNPSGNILEGIDRILAQFKGIVFIDEAYIDFAGSASWSERISQYPNLVVSQTLSKAGALAAARIGMAYSSPEIIALFNKVKPPYNISRLNQEAALAALEQKEQITNSIKSILREKQRLEAALLQYAFIEKVYPSAANFILAKVKDAKGLYDYLLQQGIIIRNRDKEMEGCLRISIGTPAENQMLRNCLTQYSSTQS